MKKCSKCKVNLSIESFQKNKTMPDGYQHYCKPCAKQRNSTYRKTSPEKLFATKIYSRFRLTVEEYRALMDKGCEVCGSFKQLCIDHDHSCCPAQNRICGKCIRGVLCRNCNLAEGFLMSDIKTAEKMLEYIKKHKEEARG